LINIFWAKIVFGKFISLGLGWLVLAGG